MNRWRRLLATLLFVTVTAAACGGDGDGDAEEAGGGGVDPDEVSQLVPGNLKVEVTGGLTFSWEDATDLRIVDIRDPKTSSLTFLSVGIESAKMLPEGDAFRIAFDLAGTWHGTGSYEIDPIGVASGPEAFDPENPDASAAASGLSGILLFYSPDGDPAQNPEAAAGVRRFDAELEACTLEVRDDGAAGRLSCPSVADADGTEIAVVMEWETT